MGRRHHQLDAVQLVDLEGAPVEVDADDVGQRVLAAQLAEHAAAHHVAWQAGERLSAYELNVLSKFCHNR